MVPTPINTTDRVKFDYYPGGMLMPGRQYTSGNGYEYGFNTQMKSDEISGVGNHTTAKFWEYDTRLARRWNQDPKPNPSLSNYACNANNPIWFSDPLGDTTAIYNSKGTYINTLNDKNPFQVLVTNSKFDKQLEKLKGLDLSKVNQDLLNSSYNTFSKTGITYDIKSIRDFYNKWSTAFPIKTVGGVSIGGNNKTTLNGKPLVKKLYAEAVQYLSVVNNRITVPNTKPQSDGDLLYNSAYKYLKIHFHPNIGSGNITISNSMQTSSFNFKSQNGPSGREVNGESGDYENVGGDRTQEERDIVVDKSNIYLYNSQKSQTITIPR